MSRTITQLDRLSLVQDDPFGSSVFHIDQGTLAVRAGYQMKLSERLGLRSGADLDRRLAEVTLISENDPLDDIDEVRLDLRFDVVGGTVTARRAAALGHVQESLRKRHRLTAIRPV